MHLKLVQGNVEHAHKSNPSLTDLPQVVHEPAAVYLQGVWLLACVWFTNSACLLDEAAVVLCC